MLRKKRNQMAGGRKHLEQEPGCASLLSLQWIFPAHTSFVRLFVNILPDLKTYSKKGHFATLSPKSVELLRSLSAEWKRDGNPARSSEQIRLFLPFSVSPIGVVQWDKSALAYCVDSPAIHMKTPVHFTPIGFTLDFQGRVGWFFFFLFTFSDWHQLLD